MNVSSTRSRKITQWATALLLLSAPGFSFAGQLVGDTTPKLMGPALIEQLLKGGYIIYFRHGTTAEVEEKDLADSDLLNCALQRNLSDAGQAQTKAIGAAFRTMQIPIGEVYSSPYCRCLDSGRNIFGKATVSKALHFAVHLRHSDRVRINDQLLAMFGTVPAPRTNTALVSHTANLQEAVGIWPKPEGVAHIFKPLGDGNFSYVGVMQPEVWALEAARSPDRGPGWVSALTGWLRGPSSK